VAGFQFLGGGTQLIGNFAEENCSAAFGFRRDFVFHEMAEALQFFVDAFAKFFKFIHERFLAATATRGGWPRLGYDLGIIGTALARRKEQYAAPAIPQV
jgi:hypothetical protein